MGEKRLVNKVFKLIVFMSPVSVYDQADSFKSKKGNADRKGYRQKVGSNPLIRIKKSRGNQGRIFKKSQDEQIYNNTNRCQRQAPFWDPKTYKIARYYVYGTGKCQ